MAAAFLRAFSQPTAAKVSAYRRTVDDQSLSPIASADDRVFEIASRPVRCGDYLRFVADGGYERPKLWLSDEWAARQRHGWAGPLSWRYDATGSGWRLFSLRPAEPFCHVSYYETDGYARWVGASPRPRSSGKRPPCRGR